jgi:cytochrome c-type biogenesis protein CcmH
MVNSSTVRPSLGFIQKGAVVALAVAVFVAACTTEEVPTLERRANRLNKAIMCPVCPGESIDQSQNALATQMRRIVAEKLEQGWTEGQIEGFFVERYGPSVLLEPARRGFTLIVWVLPPVAVLAAALGVYLALRLMRRSPALQPESVVDGVQLSDDERTAYFRQIEAALESDSTEATRAGDSSAPGPRAEGGVDG